METIFVTALAYTVMASDDQHRIAVNAPLAIISLAAPAAYHDKFCVEIANVDSHKAIMFRGWDVADPTNTAIIWPLTSKPITLKDGVWTNKEECPPRS